MNSWTWSRYLLAGLLLAAGSAGNAQTAAPEAAEPNPQAAAPAPETKPPPQADEKGGTSRKDGKDRYEWRGRGPDGDRRGPSSGRSMGGRPPMWGEGFEKLSEDQKRRVREALGKAWGRPEVAAARDKVMAANDEMRRAIHEALLEIDPETAKILQNMRGPEGFGGRGEPPRLPPVESDEFPAAAIKRLEKELLMFSPPERRESSRELHARLLEKPAVQEAVRRLNAAAVGERLQAMEALRKVYREAVSEEVKKYRESASPSEPKTDAPAQSPPEKAEAKDQ